MRHCGEEGSNADNLLACMELDKKNSQSQMCSVSGVPGKNGTLQTIVGYGYIVKVS